MTGVLGSCSSSQNLDKHEEINDLGYLIPVGAFVSLRFCIAGALRSHSSSHNLDKHEEIYDLGHLLGVPNR